MTTADIKALDPGVRLRYRLGWWGRAELVLWTVIVSHVANWLVSSVYFLLTQVSYQVRYQRTTVTIMSLKHGWDQLPTYFGIHHDPWWAWLRHDIRQVGIGLVAGLFVQGIAANPLGWEPKKPGPLTRAHLATRRQLRRSSLPQLLATLIVVPLAGIPGFVLGVGIVRGLPTLARWGDHLAGGSWGTREVQLLAAPGAWQLTLIGVLASFVFARYFAAKPMSDVQLFFIERQVEQARAGRRPILFTRPPVYRLRYRYMLDNNIPVAHHGKWVNIVLPAAAFIAFLLTGFGFWLLYFGPAATALH